MPPAPLDAGLSGWPRLLPAALTGAFDGPAAVAEVWRAIELERGATTRPLELRVDAAEALDAEQGLWRLQVALPPRQRLQRWEGALLWRDLTQGGLPWSAEVLDADPRKRWLSVETDPGTVPELGPLWARPFDFLRAPHALLEARRLRGVHADYGRLLGAAAGALDGPAGVRPWDGHRAWTHGWAMVWGPPGTGKTHTLVHAVARLLRDPDERVLVVSTTNRATDEVALRLGPLASGVLRLGTVDVARFRAAGRLDVLPRPVERLAQLEVALARVAAARTPEERARALRALSLARRRVPRLPDVLAEDTPRCVVSTVHAGLSAVVHLEMDPFHAHGRAPFTTVVVDEAGLVPRAAVSALGLLAARQVVLVGDPRQLSPICVAARSMEPRVKRWLALSGMQHAGLRHPATQALMRQRRMHPHISAVVSRFQYDGLLQDDESVHDRPLPAAGGRLATWPRAAWVVLERCAGLDETAVAAERAEGRSWVRPAGIEVLERLLGRYPELGRLRGLFISPYRGQAAAAGALLARLGLAETWGASTVHAQQGSEADVVVFDLVCHGGWAPPEWKRLVNVALSRARHQLLFLAATPELDQGWLLALKEELRPCTVRADGRLVTERDPAAQGALFATSVDAVEARAPAVVSPRPAEPPDPTRLGAQIRASRAARRSMTRAQAQLVRRDLRDLGPRVVRGVAGSGKTIVLARWAALELSRGEPEATVVFGNTALEGHLKDLLAQAWRVTQDDKRAEPPWERLHLVHVRALLADLLREAGLPAPTGDDRFDLDPQARALAGRGLPPRFDRLYIDEAQDLGHETLALLISLVRPVREGEALLRPVRVFYDNAQNVYRRSMPRWAEFGLDMRGRAAVLRESFRATRPGMELALDLLHALRPLDQDPDLRELIAPRTGPPLLVRRPDGRWRADFCVVQGQEPVAELFEHRQAELAGLVATVQGWRDEGVAERDIRVLAPKKDLCEAATGALRAAGVPAVHARNRELRPRDARVVVTTPQSFKGHEAELVAVVGLDAFCTRDRVVLWEALYVALTRARTWMAVSAAQVAEDAPGAPIVAALRQAMGLRAPSAGVLPPPSLEPAIPSG